MMSQHADGSTPLHLAASKGHTGTVRVLVTEWKHNVNAVSRNGSAPLHYAAQNGHTETVRVLVSELQSDVNAVTNDGLTPLHLAASDGHTETVHVLVTELQSDLKSVDHNGFTPLHYAAQNGHTETVRLLAKLESDMKASPASESILEGDVSEPTTHTKLESDMKASSETRSTSLECTPERDVSVLATTTFQYRRVSAYQAFLRLFMQTNHGNSPSFKDAAETWHGLTEEQRSQYTPSPGLYEKVQIRKKSRGKAKLFTKPSPHQGCVSTSTAAADRPSVRSHVQPAVPPATAAAFPTALAAAAPSAFCFGALNPFPTAATDRPSVRSHVQPASPERKTMGIDQPKKVKPVKTTLVNPFAAYYPATTTSDSIPVTALLVGVKRERQSGGGLADGEQAAQATLKRQQGDVLQREAEPSSTHQSGVRRDRVEPSHTHKRASPASRAVVESRPSAVT